MRLTKIICTIGPSSSSDEGIRALVSGGMDVARLNLSHGAPEMHRETVRRIRRLNEQERSGIGILLDTKGAEIRTGDVEEKLPVTRGQEYVFVPQGMTPLPDERRPIVRVNYAEFGKDVLGAERIMLDNGDLSFELVEVRDDGCVILRALDDGSIGSRRHINLPGADVSLPSLTETDWECVRMGCEEGVDFLALSFIRTADEVRDVRAFVEAQHGDLSLITKIETRQALEHIDEIIDVSDSIMVARGDLGTEIPFQRIPAVQDDLVRRCRAAGKPVIVATHMLESMIKNPLPTRAEVTDVAHAAVTRADCTMLSGETASGLHPTKALAVMSQILSETEAGLALIPVQRLTRRLQPGLQEANAAAAVTVAQVLGAKAILAITRSGRTVKEISLHRPTCPIVAVTDDPWVQRRLRLSYGVHPIVTDFSDDPEVTVATAFEAAKNAGILKRRDEIVLVSDVRTAGSSIGSVQARVMP